MVAAAVEGATGWRCAGAGAEARADGGVVTTMWFDKVKACVGWDLVDGERIAKLRDSVDSDYDEVIEALGRQLVQLRGAQSLMTNARFVQRLHGLLREWLMGLLEGTFDEEHVKARWSLGRRLAEADLSVEDIILLKSTAQKLLLELAQGRWNEPPQTLWATVCALDRALCLDLALIYNGYLQAHEAELERVMLDRFLAITGFSRTLYENLAETREWSGVDLERTSLA